MNFGLYTHPEFIDVRMLVRKAFFVPEKSIWKLTITWFHRRGYEIANDKLIITDKKRKEFIKV